MTEYKKITPYDDDASSKKGQVTSMFDKIAPYYDTLNRVLSLGIDVIWRKKAINLLKKNAPKKILDIATGTSDLAIEAARQLKPEKIIGLDISANMLAIGEKKITQQKLNNIISLEQGDSESLRFESDTFDAVMAAFGVRNFENLKAGLREMYRVTKPGGQLMILEFSRPRKFPLKQGFNIYFKNILPVIGRYKSKDKNAYKYLYESVQVFPDYDSFSNILHEIGFRNASFKVLTGGICCIYLAEK